MKWAWVENDVIRDVAHDTPSEIYHPDVAALYTVQVPDEACNGDGWVKGQLVKPEVSEVIPPVFPRTWDCEAVRSGLTLSEKVVWDTDGKPEVVTAKLEFATPLLYDDAKSVLDFLVASDVISQASEDKILA